MADTTTSPRATMRRAPERDCRDADGELLLAFVAEGDFAPILDRGDHAWTSAEPLADLQTLRHWFVVKFRDEPAPVVRLQPCRGVAGCGLEISAAESAKVEWARALRWTEYTSALDIVERARAAKLAAG